jgi:hypothetical protein
MKPHRNRTLLFILLVASMGLTACGESNLVSDEARIETRVAEALTVAATLTASAPSPVSPSTPVAATEEPTVPAPSATSISPTVAPTDTPIPTETAAEIPTDTPLPTETAAEIPTDTPVETPVVLGFLPVDGNDGNDFLRSSFPDNQGRVVLFPGFALSEISAPVSFQDRMVMRVEIFDTRAGLNDGAGIQEVTFTVEDADGHVVHTRTEKTPGYCIFGGGEPDCNVRNFEQENFRWPNEEEIVNGDYLARIDIVPEEGEKTQWRQQFVIDIPGRDDYANPPTPEPEANTARISSIGEEGDRFVVDFEAFGFTPILPGQHLHFFWNSVPPAEAGVPGGGPWKLYPASNGASGASPFTLFGVQDRPGAATQICVLVANPNHSVNQGTGNCVDLP